MPTAHGRHAQVIDVADLADWICRAGVADMTGTVDAVGPPLRLTDVLAAASCAAGFDGTTVELDDDALLAGGVRHWAGPGSLPLWLPPELDGMAGRSGAAFIRAGGRARPLADTMARVLTDERRRGLTRVRRSGLTDAEEAALTGA
ncbi:hypothetical protein [Tessaracoccus coleopterorum]|uniref:hypothetical protein n=1 Tax=Tessaracoccus coleopterorum TaxID=2714950 RepID=UPI0018D3AE91|nr:hypothetical protein [Tessaracoccus coleopterorum]